MRDDIQDRNGVRVRVSRDPDGSVVQADCLCFGNPKRMHSSPECPSLRKEIPTRWCPACEQRIEVGDFGVFQPHNKSAGSRFQCRTSGNNYDPKGMQR